MSKSSGKVLCEVPPLSRVAGAGSHHLPALQHTLTDQYYLSLSADTTIIIILRLRSSRPQVSSIDGGLAPFPTADCHLTGYQDPPKTMNIVGEQGSLSSGFPPMSRNIHCKFSDRLIFRQAEHMTKEPQLPKPDSFNKRSCFCKAVDGCIWYPIDSLDVQHDSIAGRAKRIDFVLHVLGDDPRLAAIQ